MSEGHEVVGVSRSDELNPVFLPYHWGPAERLKKFSFLRMDLNEKAEEIGRLAREQNLAWVANFAAQSMVAESWLTPVHWYQTNVVANVRLHEELRKWDGLKKYLHVTTPEVYGSCSGVVREDAPFNPSTPYAASRAACDLHLMTFFKRYNFPVVFTRAANVYGPGQQLYRIVPRAALFSRLQKKLPRRRSFHAGVYPREGRGDSQFGYFGSGTIWASVPSFYGPLHCHPRFGLDDRPENWILL